MPGHSSYNFYSRINVFLRPQCIYSTNGIIRRVAAEISDNLDTGTNTISVVLPGHVVTPQFKTYVRFYKHTIGCTF